MRLQGVDWRASTLYLNIDPVLEGQDVESAELVRCALKVFGNVIVNSPLQPNFARAVKWGWSQPQKPWFFYLQADWELMRDIDIVDIIVLMQHWDAVNLRAYAGDRGERLCLSPLFIKTALAKRLASEMIDTAGPEAQLRPPGKGTGFREGGRSLAVGVRSCHWPLGTKDKDVIVRDLGRKWMKENKLCKKGGRSFVQWARETKQ